jgi:hypothetical protein
MGAILQSVLQGLGKAGSEAAEGQAAAKQQRLAELDRQQKLLQSQLTMKELQQRMQAGAAPQFVGSHADPMGNLFNTKRNPLTGALTDEPGGKQAVGTYKPLLTKNGDYVLYNDITRDEKPMVDEKGNVVQGFPKGRNGPLIIDGKPGGIIRNGQPIVPGDPDWDNAAAFQLASYLRTYSEGEEVKNKRIDRAAQARIDAYMKTRMYGAMDAMTGSLVFVNPDEMRKNPGRYAPAAPSIQAKNRESVFKEIDTTKGFLQDAISALPNDAFDAKARAQVAYVLKDDDPRSAWQTFKQSEVAQTLSPQQIDYVTALVSMDESAMSLRSVAGMGAGSDMLRSAITKMLPGANTPSKAYALRQLKIFDGELQALRTSVPNIGEPGLGGGATATPQKGKGTQDDPIVVQ